MVFITIFNLIVFLKDTNLAQLQSILCGQRCGKKVGLGEEERSVINTVVLKHLLTLLWRISAKGFSFESGSPIKLVLDPEHGWIQL